MNTTSRNSARSQVEPDAISNFDCFWVGCSEHSAANEIIGRSPSNIIFHDNVANLVSSADINCLSAMHYAVESCGVKNIVVCGHHGCRGVKAAIENPRLDILSSWLRPVIRMVDKYQPLLEHITEASNLIDALCELNVIEQVAAVCRTTVVQDAWKNGRELSVSGLVFDRQNVPFADLRVNISGNDLLSTEYESAMAAFARRHRKR